MLQTGENFYLLELEAGQQIAAVLKPGQDGVAVVLKPSKPGQATIKARFEIDENGEKSITLPPGTIIILPVGRPSKFELSLTGGVYLYNSVDFYHRAKLEVIEPIRTPPAGTFTAVMRKLNTDFTGSYFVACARPNNPALGREFVEIRDIEVLETKTGQAQLALSLPPAIGQLDGFVWSKMATPIDLRIVNIRNKDDPTADLIAEKTYYIGSEKVAALISAFVTLIAYLAPLLLLRSLRKNRGSSRKGFNLGGITIKRSSSVSQSQKALEDVIPARKHGPIFFSPIWLGRGRRGSASLSSLQITVWTYLVFGIASYIFIMNGRLINITNSILILLGISGSASVAARITASRQEERAEIITTARSMSAKKEALEAVSYPSWSDLISSGGRIDLARLQMLVFTFLTAAYVGITAAVTFQFPELPDGLLWLMGISNGVYLGGKIAEPSIANRLAETDLRRRAAESDRDAKKAIVDELEKQIAEREMALEEIDEKIGKKSAGKALDKLKSEKKDLEEKIVDLKTRSTEAGKALKEATETLKKLNDAYSDMVKQLNDAVERGAGAN
jgi:hypothetical protein